MSVYEVLEKKGVLTGSTFHAVVVDGNTIEVYHRYKSPYGFKVEVTSSPIAKTLPNKSILKMCGYKSVAKLSCPNNPAAIDSIKYRISHYTPGSMWPIAHTKQISEFVYAIDEISKETNS